MVNFSFLIKHVTVTHNVNNSAIATEIHIPFIPKIIGRISTTDNWNTSVLKNEIAADIKPLFKAVKNDEPNILKPLIKKAKQNIWKPCFVMTNSSALYPTNNFARGPEIICAIINNMMPHEPISLRLFLNKFFNSQLFLLRNENLL